MDFIINFLHLDNTDISSLITNLAGWIPAIILPTATISQITKIIRSRSTAGVSLATWLLFGIANIGLYIFTEKYLAIQSLVGLLGTAIMDFVIVALIIFIKEDAELSSAELEYNKMSAEVSETSEA
ncbi:MAG: hypothetical protein AAF609_02590 [Cyanobacteria bacterium P01_C01_bin.120]